MKRPHPAGVGCTIRRTRFGSFHPDSRPFPWRFKQRRPQDVFRIATIFLCLRSKAQQMRARTECHLSRIVEEEELSFKVETKSTCAVAGRRPGPTPAGGETAAALRCLTCSLLLQRVLFVVLLTCTSVYERWIRVKSGEGQ